MIFQISYDYCEPSTYIHMEGLRFCENKFNSSLTWCWMYLFLQVELERVFVVLLALLYEQEYMDTAEKKNEHLRLSLKYNTIKYSFPEILNYM